MKQRYLIIANIEKVKDANFISILLYGEDGYLLDEIAKPFESWTDTMRILGGLLESYRLSNAELWTSEKALFVEALRIAGIAPSIKHRSDTMDTARAIERKADLLCELYELEEEPQEKAELPRWRAFLIRLLKQIVKRLEGEY